VQKPAAQFVQLQKTGDIGSTSIMMRITSANQHSRDEEKREQPGWAVRRPGRQWEHCDVQGEKRDKQGLGQEGSIHNQSV